MRNNNVVGTELLKQNGLDPEKVSDERRRQMEQALAKEERRVLRIRRTRKVIWLVTAAWPAAAIPIALMISWGRGPGHGVSLFGLIFLGWCILVPCAILCSAVTYITARTTGMRQIQASLVHISNQLRELSEAHKP